MELKKLISTVIVSICTTCFPAYAESPSLHKIFTDNMVLQRDMQVPVWGTSDAGDRITVSFSGQTKEAVADKDGKWLVKLAPLNVSATAQTMTITSSKITQSPALQIKNILVGDVWLCSGQSNMAFQLKGVLDAENEIKEAKNPGIRIFPVVKGCSEKPSSDLKGSWLECSPATIRNFSGVAYYFGKELNSKLGVPIGLIKSAVGSTPAQSWISMKGLESSPGLEPILADFRNQVENIPALKRKYEEDIAEWEKLYAGKKPGDTLAGGGKVPVMPHPPLSWDNPKTPSVLYNAMINPLVPFAIKGVIWYQGESNAQMGSEYKPLLSTLIADWRRNWGQGDFPFLIVQLANFGKVSKEPVQVSKKSELMEAQYLVSKELPNAGLAVTVDIGGDGEDIHPKNKKDVGIRLALAARKAAYGENIVFSGPTYESMQEVNGKLRIRFANVGSGLEARGGELKTFAISNGSKLVWAKAEIEPPSGSGKVADSVIVWSDEVKNPTAVRYAWSENPVGCNLYNKEGLPAVPFRTDTTQEAKK